MKKFMIIAALAAMAILPGKNLAAQSLKFGHINRNDLIQAMPEFDSARVKLQKLNTDLSNALDLLQVEYNNKAQAYIKDSKNLTDIVRQTKEQELQDYQKRISDFQANAQTQLQEQQTALFTPITEKADKAIREVGKENGFLYIFDTSGGQIAYVDESRSTNVLPMVKAKLGIK